MLISLMHGMRFKIYVKSEASTSKSTKAYAYCKTSGEAKSLRRIANRGLMRVMWGKSIDRDLQYVRNILQKSPSLAKLNFNSIRKVDGDKMEYSTRNSTKGVSNVTSIAMRNGIKQFNKVFDKTFNYNKDYISKWKANIASKLKETHADE